MKNVLSEDERNAAIASIRHNLECIKEAEQIMEESYSREKARLTRLLHEYERGM